MLQPLSQALLLIRRQTPESGIALQSALLFGGREAAVVAEPVARMSMPRVRLAILNSLRSETEVIALRRRTR